MYKSVSLHEVIQYWDCFERIKDEHYAKVMAKVQQCFNFTSIVAWMLDARMYYKTHQKLKQSD
jgi:hypothetical protein